MNNLPTDDPRLPHNTTQGDLEERPPFDDGGVDVPVLKDYEVEQEYSATITVTRDIQAYSKEEAVEAFELAEDDLGDHNDRQEIAETHGSIGDPVAEEV